MCRVWVCGCCMLRCVGISGLRLLGYWLISVGCRWILVVLGYEELFTFWLGLHL